jgi:hypothetical protein
LLLLGVAAGSYVCRTQLPFGTMPWTAAAGLSILAALRGCATIRLGLQVPFESEGFAKPAACRLQML